MTVNDTLSDAEHLLDLCSRSVRRLHEIAKLDPIPSVLVRGEADVLEKYVVELTLGAGANRAVTVPLSEMVRVMCPRAGRECECAAKGQYQDFDSCRLVYQHANALQDHIRKSPDSGWQPIDTAPKDRPVILGTKNWAGGLQGIWVTGSITGHPAPGWYLSSGSHALCGAWTPTHWMPLPPPPITSG